MIKRNRREYLQLLDSAKNAAESAINNFNNVWHPYRNEATLLLLVNAWELLAKAVLLLEKESIFKSGKKETISAELAIYKLQNKKIINQNEAETIQQAISLRHAACHHILPEIPVEIMQHLLFYCSKYFRDLTKKKFPAHVKDLNENYLSLSFSDLTTYADKIQKSVSKIKRNGNEKKLIWLLERGIKFTGESYITETQFDKKYLDKKKVLSYLGINHFIKNGEMVRIIPIQAPHNVSVDVAFRKGNSKDSSLPIVIKKTNLETDYPYLTKELAQKINKNSNWVAKAITVLNLKNDERYHQAIRASSKGNIQRYSDAMLNFLLKKLKDDPNFNPYEKL